MLSMGQIKKGVMVVLEEEPYLVVSAEFTRKQQSRPVMRTVLKNIKTGQTKEHSFMQSDKVQEANVGRRDFDFLYESGDRYVFMDKNSFDQVEVGEDVVGEAARFLTEGQSVEMVLFDDVFIQVDLPIKIDRQVTSAPPGIKGDTSTNVMKEVEVEGGAKVKAPLFVKEGDRIRIDTRTGTYVERVT
jgi:elongation factor P